MARLISKLSSLKIARTTDPGRYSDGGGLYLQISRHGAKSWIFRYRLLGRERDMGLGPLHTISLSQARQRAAEYRRKCLDGIDPINQRRELRQQTQLSSSKAKTFKACGEAYVHAQGVGWRNAKHASQWTNTLTSYAYPVLGDLPVRVIDIGLVMKVLEPLWQTKPETASRLRGRIEKILDWAKVRGYRDGDNPARWHGTLQSLLPARSKIRQVIHHSALAYDEIGAFMMSLKGEAGIAARALEFTILTAARTGEAIGARRDEFDENFSIWTVPATRIKAGKEHRVPLSPRAAEIAEAMLTAHNGEYIFPGAKLHRPLSNMAMAKVLERMGRDDITVHGFRSTFRDWAAERTNYPREVVEMALAHAIENKVEAAYRRGDLLQKRRNLMAAWEVFCSRNEEAHRVVSLSARTA